MTSHAGPDNDGTVPGPTIPESHTVPGIDSARSASACTDGNALPPGTRLGEFELTRVLGEGGFSIVYLARDHSLERHVAIKEYIPASLASRTHGAGVAVRSERHRQTFEMGLRSFINEARLLAQFDHPSLVKVFRFWEANGTAYMAMPFYQGTTLRDRLHELGRAPDEAWLMSLLGPLTDALAVIHADHCYHRDIAPDNIILLAGSGQPLLLDFGAARRVIGDMTHALTVFLKPGYAPIEQYAEGSGMAQGPWTDVYALAAVVYCAIVGHTPPTAVARVVEDHNVPLGQCAAGRYSDRFLQAIDRALRVRPEHRTASIAAFRREIGLGSNDAPRRGAPPALPTLTGETAPAAPIEMQAQPAARRTSAAWFAGIGTALLALGIAAYVAQRDAARPAPPPDRVLGAPPAAIDPAERATPGLASGTASIAEPSPAVAGSASFSVESEFDRIAAAASPAFSVEAFPRHSQFRVGRDALAFSVKSSREGHVYVLLHGSDDSLLLLFPNSRSAQNRIRAGQTLQLPQSSWPMIAAEPAGTQHFLVLVSQSQRDFDAISQGREEWFVKLPTGEAGRRLASNHRGTGSVIAGRAACAAEGCDAYGAGRFAVDVVP
jgi:hypothetical protein